MRQTSNRNGLRNQIGLCHFLAYEDDQSLAILKAVTGWDITPEEMVTTAHRGLTLARLFNLREGMSRADDRLPARFSDPLPKHAGLTREQQDKVVTDYYVEQGWDSATGVPTAETIRALELEADAVHARSRPGLPPLTHHRERALDVGQHARAPRPIVAVRGERLLVSRGELRGDALLDLVERGAGGRLLAHSLDHVVDVAPERAEPLATGDIAVAHDDVREIELGEPVERRRPLLRVAVAHEGRPADHRVPGDDDLLPREIDEHVAGRVSPPEMQQMD